MQGYQARTMHMFAYIYICVCVYVYVYVYIYIFAYKHARVPTRLVILTTRDFPSFSIQGSQPKNGQNTATQMMGVKWLFN